MKKQQQWKTFSFIFSLSRSCCAVPLTDHAIVARGSGSGIPVHVCGDAVTTDGGAACKIKILFWSLVGQCRKILYLEFLNKLLRTFLIYAVGN